MDPTTASRPPSHPRTAPDSSPSSDDSSYMIDLSFDYVQDENGKFVRVSKGSANSRRSSPPTPEDYHPPHSAFAGPSLVATESVESSSRKTSPPRYAASVSTSTLASTLSRSESLTAVDSPPPPIPRSFTRVTSTPASSTLLQSSSLNGSIQKTASKLTGSALRGFPMRLTPEQAQQREEMLRREREQDQDDVRRAQEEKENIAAMRSTTATPSTRASHIKLSQLKTGSKLGQDVYAIPELESTDRDSDGASNDYYSGNEEQQLAPPPSATARQRAFGIMGSSSNGLVTSLSRSGTRPRRSASLSDATAAEDQRATLGTSAHRVSTQASNLAISGSARRVTHEENVRRAEQIAAQNRHRTEVPSTVQEEGAEPVVDGWVETPPRSHSPPTPPQNGRPAYTHHRRDSDTLRSLALALPGQACGVATNSNVASSQHSPPSASSGHHYDHVRSQPLSSSRHRRSPTAPETTGNTVAGSRPLGSGAGTSLAPQSGAKNVVSSSASVPGLVVETQQQKDAQRLVRSSSVGPTIAASAGRERERERETQAAQQLPMDKRWTVNKRVYAKLDMIGKGGSSRVYRAMQRDSNEIYAIKRVAMDKLDHETMAGYMNEISLLKRLDGNSRIIRLVDSELKSGPNGSKGHLMLVMECGEIDLAKLLAQQQNKPLNTIWVAYYWQQMLEAVQVIHDEKIVHSDLKPANFVLVRGELKLIDFGIANAIANDTTNIQRDHQIGTVNYMSPEAIEVQNDRGTLKVGRPSDVWSLGCILYQMVYGHPPFSHLGVYQKMKAIPDKAYKIEYPQYAVPSIPQARSGSPTRSAPPPQKLEHLKRLVPEEIVETMQRCLCRPSKERALIPDLLRDDWLAMKEPKKPHIIDLLKPDETVISPFYMRQLLNYATALGRDGEDLTDDHLDREAERLVKELQRVFREAVETELKQRELDGQSQP